MRSELQQLVLEQRLDALNLTPQTDGNTVTLEEAGLEESGEQPLFGFGLARSKKTENHVSGGINELIEWFSDGQDSRYETN